MLKLLNEDFPPTLAKASKKKKGREVPIICGKGWQDLKQESCTLESGEEYVFEYRTCLDCGQKIERKLNRCRNGETDSSVTLFVAVPGEAKPCILLKDKNHFQNWTGGKIREIESRRLRKHAGEEQAEDL